MFRLQNETSNSDLDEISVTISPDRSVKKCPKFEKKYKILYSRITIFLFFIFSQLEPVFCHSICRLILILSVYFFRTRCAYSTREKQAILQFIIASKRYKEVKGNKLWRDMEEANVSIVL